MAMARTEDELASSWNAADKLAASQRAAERGDYARSSELYDQARRIRAAARRRAAEGEPPSRPRLIPARRSNPELEAGG